MIPGAFGYFLYNEVKLHAVGILLPVKTGLYKKEQAAQSCPVPFCIFRLLFLSWCQ
ncbi:hypothetical protein HMPREF0083_06045 [Aneurinibacillus aneurinilyticus ATCC 12856]|uniref:Uncharacterized protein n=1 Tax=Aneurinibacillus aneurinilyticus ATCC 12856 TaxID=649747 RepID=U1XWT2_ANEAE|nr:hypothetical protein HMPREF0083_06045 [Aneurinibacillus aneurinilyticus ATCC 12856]